MARGITIHCAEDIEMARRAGRLAAEVLSMVEPYVVPKRNLTGDSLERVDTRVLQLIYEFDRPKFPVFVGQQVDVFIQRPAAGTDAPTGHAAVPR